MGWSILGRFMAPVPLTASTLPPLCRMGLSKVPSSTPQAQMLLDAQVGALPPWSSSLSLLPHPRPAGKPSRQDGLALDGHSRVTTCWSLLRLTDNEAEKADWADQNPSLFQRQQHLSHHKNKLYQG